VNHELRHAGRKPKQLDDRQTTTIWVRVTEREYAAIKERADELELSLSAYLRGLALSKQKRPRLALDLLEIAEQAENLISIVPDKAKTILTEICTDLGAAARRRA
jgi:hypothetical protein